MIRKYFGFRCATSAADRRIGGTNPAPEVNHARLDPDLTTLFADALDRTDPAERAAYLDRRLRRRRRPAPAGRGAAGRPRRGRPVPRTRRHAGRRRGRPPSAGRRRTRPAGPATGRDARPPDPDATTARGSATPRPRGRRPDGRRDRHRHRRPVHAASRSSARAAWASVYLAEQTEPVKRQVALKLIKTGMDSRAVLARFDAERQALALMDHPNIARVYDGGTTAAGQPFFVMELVQRRAAHRVLRRARGCRSRARLELFVAVCQAVQHAHQKGIIHRDLKPGNVLVTEVDGRPTPKVIDFGVAKATELKLTDHEPRRHRGDRRHADVHVARSRPTRRRWTSTPGPTSTPWA